MRLWTTISGLVTFSMVVTAIRIEDLRKKRPVECTGLVPLLLHDGGPVIPFPTIVEETGRLRFNFKRKNGRNSIDKIRNKLTETDGKFARAVNKYVSSLVTEYNGIVHQYLSRWGQKIIEDDVSYNKAIDAIGFQDKSDNFAFLSYLNDTGSDTERIFDNLLFYTVPRSEESSNSKRRIVDDQIQILSRWGLHPVTPFRITEDFWITTLRIAKKLSTLETNLHWLSKIFSKGFLQWLRVYHQNDTSEKQRNYIITNFPVLCKIWVNI